MPITPTELVRRLYKQLEKGRGMRFSPAEMDMLAEMGAIDAVSKFAAEWIRQQSEERLAASRAEQASATPETSRSTQLEQHYERSYEEAGDRARELSRPNKRADTSSLSGEAVEEALRRARSRTKRKGKRK